MGGPGDVGWSHRRRAGLIASVALSAVAGLGLSACSSARAAGRPANPPTTVAPTTTTRQTYGTFPLTGLPVYDPALARRPALSVKVDNAAPARPQSGLNAADIVTEELVEGGLTRFFVTYQSQDAPTVGPVRSARPVDADLLRELGGGLFAYSGAAAGEIAPVRAHSTAFLISDDAGDPGFHRVGDRPAPFNLYVSTPALYQFGARRVMPPPPPLFTYTAAPPPATSAAGGVSLIFSPFSSSQWTWSASTGLYQRSQDGAPAVLADGTPITATDVVILSVGTRGTGIMDASHHEDPFVVVTGSGPCWVLRDGVLVQGTWQRRSYDVPVQLFGPDGTPLGLRPGRTWLELLPRPASPGFS